MRERSIYNHRSQHKTQCFWKFVKLPPLSFYHIKKWKRGGCGLRMYVSLEGLRKKPGGGCCENRA